ncbi:SDR family NAD(P)-dependent oxidoreductase [Vibrio gallicus]|uniref:SDR family NAD(P)-dependent oxidoreductase n=1 Tax=Vibrio gallicus TaxID=190897 RepID=UPI0021C2E03B|nr:SDR family oxidoreductase [Vibrio gallicus]
MQLGLQEKHVVVTGGSSGIGAEIVLTFAQEGARVWFCGRSQHKIDASIASLGALSKQVIGTSVDVTDASAFQSWIDSIPSIDVFVPNVSALSNDWSDMIAHDIMATQQAIESVLPKLLQSSCGALTYIGSKASGSTIAKGKAYGAAKAAMAHYMKSLSLTHAPILRVNTVSPGDTYIENGHWGKIKREHPDFFNQVLDNNPMGRFANPDEVANVVVFVSSPAASFVSGSNWYVDGASSEQVQY